MSQINKDVYVYDYHGGIYINLTNRCTNACKFCLRNKKDGLNGHKLWLKKEPTSGEIIDMLKPYPSHKNITFCGYGEPMIRLDVLKDVAAYAKQNGISVKVDTNGQANLIHKHDVLPKLVRLVDVFSISLNHDNALDYQKDCQSEFGLAAFDAILNFSKQSVSLGFKTILSVVDFIDKDEIKRCEQIAKNIGADFRVRRFG